MFKNTSLLKYSKKYSLFSYIKINLISCIIFKFMSIWLGTTMSTWYGSGESLLLRSIFQQLTILVDALINYKLLCDFILVNLLFNSNFANLRALLMAQLVKNPPASSGDARDAGLIPGSEWSPWRRKWQPIPVFLSRKFHGHKNLMDYSVCDHKELDKTKYICPHACMQIYANHS